MCQSLDQLLAPQYKNEISCKCVKYLLHRMIQSLQKGFTICITQGQQDKKYNSGKHITSMSLIIFMCHRQNMLVVDSRPNVSSLFIKRSCMDGVCSHKGSVQTMYWQMTLWWIYKWQDYIYMHIWLGGVLAICVKQVFSYIFIKHFDHQLGTTDGNQ